MEYDLAIAVIALVLVLVPRRRVREYGLMFGLAFLFMQLIARAAYIPSKSMQPTLMVEDRLLVNVLRARLLGPERGSVVLFRSPENNTILCKRVLGMEGDLLSIRQGQLIRNGEPVSEPYVTGPMRGRLRDYRVPPGHFFALGDNRNDSRDSRFFGPIPSDRLVGKAEAVFWPLQRLSWL